MNMMKLDKLKSAGCFLMLLEGRQQLTVMYVLIHELGPETKSSVRPVCVQATSAIRPVSFRAKSEVNEFGVPF